jgi:hypothetical protein
VVCLVWYAKCALPKCYGMAALSASQDCICLLAWDCDCPSLQFVGQCLGVCRCMCVSADTHARMHTGTTPRVMQSTTAEGWNKVDRQRTALGWVTHVLSRWAHPSICLNRQQVLQADCSICPNRWQALQIGCACGVWMCMQGFGSWRGGYMCKDWIYARQLGYGLFVLVIVQVCLVRCLLVCCFSGCSGAACGCLCDCIRVHT